MNEEKAKILKRIEALIDKRREEILKSFMSVHELNDGIVLRSFNDWDNCNDNENIKYKIISNRKDFDEIIIFNFIPKGTKLDIKVRTHIQCMTILSGKLELNDCDGASLIDSYSKIVLNNNEFGGIALEDTYVVTSNKK